MTDEVLTNLFWLETPRDNCENWARWWFLLFLSCFIDEPIYSLTNILYSEKPWCQDVSWVSNHTKIGEPLPHSAHSQSEVSVTSGWPMRGQQTDPKCVCRGVSYQESDLSENWKPKTGGGEIFLLIRGRARQRESNQTILLMIRYHCKLVKSILFLTKQSFFNNNFSSPCGTWNMNFVNPTIKILWAPLDPNRS